MSEPLHSSLGSPQIPLNPQCPSGPLLPPSISRAPTPAAEELYATKRPLKGPPGRGEGNYYDTSSSAVMNDTHAPRLDQTRWISIRYVARAGVELNSIVAGWGQVVQGIRHVTKGDARTGLSQVTVAAMNEECVRALLQGSVQCSEADGGVAQLRLFVKAPPLSPKSVEIILSNSCTRCLPRRHWTGSGSRQT